MTVPQSCHTLFELETLLESRKQADAGHSYVASLYKKGIDSIAKKVGEEATEVVIASKNADDAALVYEMADLWFHTLVLLRHRNIPLESVLTELARRHGTSGLAEKAARPAT